MFVTVVNVLVKKDRINDFITATRANHEQSIRENGNMRFDILQSIEEPTQFVLYEAYKNQEDASAHKETQHYLTWRDTVADWMAAPRSGKIFNGLYPS